MPWPIGATLEVMAEAPQPVELVVSCPHCGDRVSVELSDETKRYLCPTCGQPFEMPPTRLATPTLDDAGDEVPDDRQAEFLDELDGMRIRQLAAARRAAWRTRSWVLIAAIGMGTAAAQLVLMSASAFRGAGSRWGIAYAGSAALALLVCTRLLSRARRMKRQIEREMHRDEPNVPPDFSRLNDGSQRWRNLESMR